MGGENTELKFEPLEDGLIYDSPNESTPFVFTYEIQRVILS